MNKDKTLKSLSSAIADTERLILEQPENADYHEQYLRTLKEAERIVNMERSSDFITDYFKAVKRSTVRAASEAADIVLDIIETNVNQNS